MNRLFLLPLSVTVALAACSNGGSQQPGGAADAPVPGPDAGKEATMKIDSSLEPHVDRAIADLADRLEIAESEIEVVEARFVTWPDGAVGCPKPGMMYTQALVPGYRIGLVANGTRHHYHGAHDRPPFHCPPERVGAPAAGSDESKDLR